MPETTEQTRKRFKEKDREFAELKSSGDWASKACHQPACKAGGCCLRYSHHVGDCCLHCGNDEREL